MPRLEPAMECSLLMLALLPNAFRKFSQILDLPEVHSEDLDEFLKTSEDLVWTPKPDPLRRFGNVLRIVSSTVRAMTTTPAMLPSPPIKNAAGAIKDVSRHRLWSARQSSSTALRRMPFGMAVTMVMVARPTVPLCNSTRSPTAVASLGQAGPAAGFASQFESKRDQVEELEPRSVATPKWLNDVLIDFKTKVVDASWYMPNEKRNALKEYKDVHIPGAVFFDLDKISDVTSDLPHMLPSEAAFEQAMSALGIQNDSRVVVYDTKGIFSAARVWWMFRAFGHEKVWVLDGGLPAWKAAGFPVVSHGTQLNRGGDATAAVQKVYAGEEVPESQYKATLQPHLVWSVNQVKNNLQNKESHLIDARGKARFDGTVPEPRKDIRGGHIPGSTSIPFTEVLSQSGTLLAPEELGSKFSSAGVATEGSIVASCGTGVTACILALALHRLGRDDVAVYDGSWTEWGSRTDTPVESNASTTSA